MPAPQPNTSSARGVIGDVWLRSIFLLAANSYSPRTICFHMLSLWHGCYFFAICKHSEGFPCLFFAQHGRSFTARRENWHEGAAAPQASGAFSPCAVLPSAFSSYKSSSAPVSTPLAHSRKMHSWCQKHDTAILHGRPLEPSRGFALQSIYSLFLPFPQQGFLTIKILFQSQINYYYVTFPKKTDWVARAAVNSLS